jgi:GNAT superfamily N-acetyltransferase
MNEIAKRESARAFGGRIEVRVLQGLQELVTAANVFRAAMVGLPNFGLSQEALVAELYEPGRAYGAFVDGQLIGTTDSYTSALRVPGGAELPHAAVTHVGVLPTHTRRGAATALLRTQIDRGARARRGGSIAPRF